jgi:hypothetical protein
MAQAVVFVDDAVRGDLPPVCAKTGESTWDHLVTTAPVGNGGGLGAAWLLILFGPIGWLVLLVYASTRSGETLTVKLPYADAAYEELTRAIRTRRNCVLGAGGLFIGALLLATLQTFTARAAAVALAVVGLGLVVSAISETIRMRRASVRVELDASRRWVTLSRISDELAEAIRRSDSERDLSESRRHAVPGPRSW